MIEKKSKKWTIVVGLLFIGVIISAGCVDDKPSDGGEASPSPTGEAATPTTQPSTTEAPTASSNGGLLRDILGKAKGITSVKYDMVVTSPDTPAITQKAWLKGEKMRMEMTMEGETMITIMDGGKQELYMYYPAESMAMKMDFSEAPTSAIEETASIEQYNPTTIGTETIDGTMCTVVEYDSPEGSVKMWISKNDGFPRKMEMTTSEGTIRIDWKNIEFVDISDDKFELPAGVEITDLGEMLEGLDMEDMSEIPTLPGGE